ncbi:amidophosphoribosyltransferase-like [Liolophura sinensis]|uniref:amidophosphoribosyltransferase-like n=1 Tax=Liolophura sinensis TaxID=3198878 RepID=UPI0031582AFC
MMADQESLVHFEDVDTDEFELREACGVFGCVAAGEWPSQVDVPHTISVGLVGLQHRGQESAGIVTGYGADTHRFAQKKGMGLVNQVFSEEDMVRLKGNLGIGHTRYSTAGESSWLNSQPLVVDTLHGRIAVAHNGELVNAKSLRHKILSHGVGLSTHSDSELITQLLSHTPSCGEPKGINWVGRIKRLMLEAHLSYSLVVMHKDRVYAVRDPFGNRPLCLGKLLTAAAYSGKVDVEDCEIDGYVVSSESCAFQAIGAKYYREVLPGEIVEISRDGFHSMCIVPRPENKLPAFCIFEYIYFARADSFLEGQMVYSVRKRCGKQLAIDSPVNADIVSTVPESATPAALGFSEQSGIPYAEVLCKNRYVGRTFIQPSKRLRQLGVAKKFGSLVENFKGKRIVIIDDSIVRGNTMAPIIRLLKASGAAEVHIRVASPPVLHPCYMGINIPTKEELIANHMSTKQLAQHFGADSLEYMTLDGLVSAVTDNISEKGRKIGHCTACLSGQYPTKLDW